jgi:hypothetical protein
MLFRPSTLRGIGDGTVTRAYRKWDRPRVKPGGRQRTPVGVVAFDAVEPVARESLTDADARSAGLSGLDELLELVDRRPSGTIYRIELHLAGPDPRVALREATPDAAEVATLRRRLERLDRASRHGPWTVAVLRAIAGNPGVRAADLAASFRRERAPFKLDVRKLKELGLTESLRPGYRLSPRGWAVLTALDTSPGSEDGGDPGIRQ